MDERCPPLGDGALKNGGLGSCTFCSTERTSFQFSAALNDKAAFQHAIAKHKATNIFTHKKENHDHDHRDETVNRFFPFVRAKNRQNMASNCPPCSGLGCLFVDPCELPDGALGLIQLLFLTVREWIE